MIATEHPDPLVRLEEDVEGLVGRANETADFLQNDIPTRPFKDGRMSSVDARHLDAVAGTIRKLTATILSLKSERDEALSEVRRLREAFGRLIRYFEDDDQHDEGGFREGGPDCAELAIARATFSSQLLPPTLKGAGL